MPAFPYRRPAIKSRHKKRLEQGKSGLKRTISRQSGRVFYSNPAAVAVSRLVRTPRQRVPFSFKHVEWISRNEEIARGGYGNVFFGKIKFKGKHSSQKTVIKEYSSLVNSDFSGPNGKTLFGAKFSQIISRLKKSGVPHPKMAHVNLRGVDFIIMEPFLSSARGFVATKFLTGYDMIRGLKLRRAFDKMVFKQIIEQTAGLARVGIRVNKIGDSPLTLRIDAFNRIILSDKTPKVFVQDLDTLSVSRTGSAVENFAFSCKNVLDIVCVAHPQNNAVAKQIILDVSKKEAL